MRKNLTKSELQELLKECYSTIKTLRENIIDGGYNPDLLFDSWNNTPLDHAEKLENDICKYLELNGYTIEGAENDGE